MKWYYYILLFIVLLIIILIQCRFKKSHKKLNPSQILYVHKTLKTMLKTFVNLLDKYNYTYFIHSGTLLGAIRRRNIIPHDDDIDIAIFDNELQIL